MAAALGTARHTTILTGLTRTNCKVILSRTVQVSGLTRVVQAMAILVKVPVDKGPFGEMGQQLNVVVSDGLVLDWCVLAEGEVSVIGTLGALVKDGALTSGMRRPVAEHGQWEDSNDQLEVPWERRSFIESKGAANQEPLINGLPCILDQQPFLPINSPASSESGRVQHNGVFSGGIGGYTVPEGNQVGEELKVSPQGNISGVPGVPGVHLVLGHDDGELPAIHNIIHTEPASPIEGIFTGPEGRRNGTGEED